MVTPDSPTWYVKIDDTEYGPATLAQLRQWFAEGRITADSLVRSGKGMWVLASSLPDFVRPMIPPPPPVVKREKALVDDESNWLDVLDKPKRVTKPKRTVKLPKFNAFQWMTLAFLGIVASCMLMITLVYVVLPLTFFSGMTNVIGNSNAFRIAGPVNSDFGLVTARAAGPDIGYQFAFPVKNVSNSSRDSFVLHIRAKRPNRPMADFETSDTVKIRGGCRPNETVTAYAGAGYDLVQQIQNEPESVIEVSLDKVHWFKAFGSRQP